MTSYRLWPSTNGPALTSYNGPWIGAVSFAVSGGGKWFTGYWQWIPSGGDTAPSGGFNCALYSITGSSGPTGKLIAGSTITGYAGAMTANAWNFIPLPTPIQLAPGWDQNSTASGSAYLACVGWQATHGFADTNSYWGSGGPGANGLINGPLIGYSSNSGSTNKAPWGMAQGLFSSSSSNPTTTMPIQVSGTDNFWVDVGISDTAPVGYTGSSRLWPNKADANPSTIGDAAVNYTTAIEISLSQACTLNNIWYFSPAASTTLATRCDVWNVSTGLSVASITSPTWLTAAGAAASPGTGPGGQWIKAAFPGGTTLPAGDYRVSIYNSAGSTDANWAPKDATTDYWGQTITNSVGAQGITCGPLSAPKWSLAASGYVFGGAGTDTPPFSSGGTVAPHAQPVFYQPAGSPTGAVGFPQLYAAVGVSSNQSQNYWVDLEATPNTSVNFSGEVSGVTVTAPPGTPSASMAGPVAAASVAALPGTGSVSTPSPTPANVTVAAPAGTPAGTAGASAGPAAVTVAALAGIGSAATTVPPAAAAVAAPAGTVSVTATASPGSVSVSAPAGIAGNTPPSSGSVSGQVSAVLVTALLGTPSATIPGATLITAARSMAFNAHSAVTAQATMEFEAGQPVQTGLTTLAMDPWISMYPG